MTEYQITVVVLGDACTGKTDLIRRFKGELPSIQYQPTVGAELVTLTVPHPLEEGSTVYMNIWECPGNERYLSAHGAPLLTADVCLLVCDTCVPKTLSHLAEWHDEFLQSCLVGAAPASFVVAANKCDLANERRLGLEQCAGWCGEEMVDPSLWLKDLVPGRDDVLPTPSLIETSAHTAVGVQSVLDHLVIRGVLRQKMNAVIPTRIHSIEEEQTRSDTAAAGAVRCVLMGEGENSKDTFLLKKADADDLGCETVERSTTQFTTLQNEDLKFVVWTPMTTQATTPFWFCRGAHVCLMTLQPGLSATMHRLALWKEIFLRESALRSDDSILWIVVGFRNANYLPTSSEEAAAYCAEHGLLFFDVEDEAPSTSYLLSLWQSVGELAKQHRQSLIVSRSAAQGDNIIARCPHSEYGCNWQGRAADLEHHAEKLCPHKRIQCRFDGCGATIPYGERENHERFCEKRPATCHFCDKPYGVSLVEHLKLCEKREVFENSHVACPLAEFGCPVKYVKRPEVAAHIAGDAPRHMEILSSGLQRLRTDTLALERQHKIELDARDAVHRQEVEALRAELAATKSELASTKEVIGDLKIEMKLMWQELEGKH